MTSSDFTGIYESIIAWKKMKNPEAYAARERFMSYIRTHTKGTLGAGLDIIESGDVPDEVMIPVLNNFDAVWPDIPPEYKDAIESAYRLRARDVMGRHL